MNELEPIMSGKDQVSLTETISPRDYFAGQTLAAELSKNNSFGREDKKLAQFCYEIADAMIKARGEK